jgi:hypothetical protein
VKGRTSGTRTVAGTMIFSHGSEHPLMQVLRTNHVRTTYAGSFYADEILPIDIGLTFLQSVSGPGGTEHILSQLWLRGVQVNTESLTLSINQSLTEMPMQYVAHGVDYMHRVGEELPGHRMERVPDAVAGPQSTETGAFQVVGKPMAARESAANSLGGSATALDNRPTPGQESLAAQLGESAGSRRPQESAPPQVWTPPASTPYQETFVDLLTGPPGPRQSPATHWSDIRRRSGSDPASVSPPGAEPVPQRYQEVVDGNIFQPLLPGGERPEIGNPQIPVEYREVVDNSIFQPLQPGGERPVIGNPRVPAEYRAVVDGNLFRPLDTSSPRPVRSAPPEQMVDLLREYKPPSSTMAYERARRGRQ